MADTLDTEKVAASLSTDVAAADADADALTWTPEEERRLVRRLDMLVMPILTLAFFGLQLDRGNIGNTLTDNFLEDVGITQFQYNVGGQLLSLGIVLLEIPSNLVLYKIGPTLWIGSQIVAWGMVALFQAFIRGQGYGPFLATRLLLGLCEAGFIPAGLYTIGRWYTLAETSKRFAWFFVGSMTASGCTGLLAYGLLHMRGIADLAGWQWMFIIEGIFTIAIGAVFLCFFPKSPADPVSLWGQRYFTEREAQILSQRVLRDDPNKVHVRPHIATSEIRAALTNWRLVPHVLLTTACIAPSSTMSAYAPTLVASLGFGRLKSNALVSIGPWILLVVNLVWGFVADKTQRRGPLVLLALLIFFGLTLGNRLSVYENKNLRLGVLLCSMGFSQQFHPVNTAWAASNARSAGERSVTLAVMVMAANCGGIVGSQVFQARDRPLYTIGWTVLASLTAFGVLMATAANTQYWLLNRRKRAANPDVSPRELFKW